MNEVTDIPHMVHQREISRWQSPYYPDTHSAQEEYTH